MKKIVIAALAVVAAFATAPAAEAQYHQYYQQERGYDRGYDGPPPWVRREMRERRDEARIKEAAQREAFIIEQERQQRRAYRREMREYRDRW